MLDGYAGLKVGRAFGVYCDLLEGSGCRLSVIVSSLSAFQLLWLFKLDAEGLRVEE